MAGGRWGVRRLGELEAAIMDRLWARARPATVREILDELRGQRAVAYNTVQTVAENLCHKGWLRRERHGRAYRYAPLAPRQQYSAGLMRDALAQCHDQLAAFAAFVDQMSPAEAAVLREALAELDQQPKAAR